MHRQWIQSTTLVMTACVCMSAAQNCIASDTAYAARQEVVPDFGQFVPAHTTNDRPKCEVTLERVTSAVPWGRGMTSVDGTLLVLSRGRHRGEGGIDRTINDHAGTLWVVDTSASEVVIPGGLAGEAVRSNATIFAQPTSPPFHLYDYDNPPELDLLMDRPYCALAFDGLSRNFFVCAYSGAEFASSFRKHSTDAVFRYDMRTDSWHVVEQHNPAELSVTEIGIVVSNEYYPHHDPAANPPPHGWTNGADGCIAVGRFLYVPAKDNHVVVQYDLENIRNDPDAGPPKSRPVLNSTVQVRYPGGEQEMQLLGPSSVAQDDGFLYVGYRTSSVVLRFALHEDGDIVRSADGKATADLIGVFEPWDTATGRSGNLYDIAIGPAGDVFVSMGTEGRIWRFAPDPAKPFFGNDQTDRPTTTPPFLDMSELLGRRTGCNNLFADHESGYLYISSRNNDTCGRIHGTIYRVQITENASTLPSP